MLNTFAQSYRHIRTQAEVQLSFNLDNYTVCSPELISSLIIYIFHLYLIIMSLSKSPNSIPFTPNSCAWLPQALGLLESSLDVGARQVGVRGLPGPWGQAQVIRTKSLAWFEAGTQVLRPQVNSLYPTHSCLQGQSGELTAGGGCSGL